MPGESQQLPETKADPTVFTTEAILRASAAERDYVNGQLQTLIERLNGIDRATQVLNETVNRTPTDIQKEINHIREIMTVELDSVALQFKERDTRSERESRDNKVAVDAAFAAQKEAAAKQDEANQKAIDKSEKATAETITKVSELLKTTTDGLGGKLDDMKARMTSLELMVNGIITSRAGGQEIRAEHRSDNTVLIAVGSLLLTLIIIGISVIGFIVK